MKRILILLLAATVAMVLAAAASAAKVPAHHFTGQGHLTCTFDATVEENAVQFTSDADWLAKGNPTGQWIAGSCPDVLPVVHDFDLTLLVNGGLSATIPDGGIVTYSGAYSDNGDPVAAASVDLTVFSGYGCAGSVVYASAGYFTTDTGGDYSQPSGATSTGQYSAETNVGGTTSNCVNIGVGDVAPPPVSALVLPAPENNAFLCYSAYQDNPGVWPMSVAKSLIKAGYWSPYAVPGNVPGGTNIGGYHLTCNLATGQSASDSTLGGAGEVLGANTKQDVQDVPGHYPVVGG